MKQKRTETPGWPKFDSALLQEVVAAFQRRRKSIRTRAGLACEREFSETEDGAFERLNFDLQPGFGDMRLTVWEDGKMWLRLCVSAFQRQGGWAFKDDFYGSTDDVSPEALVAMVEATIEQSFYPGSSDPEKYRERLRTIWRRVQMAS
ncbi:MAG: hypothetical protein L0211_24940 [Planctomycetaceae bacterium]|nr:hypothetical protein [Planctomycetaceae bacterium]